MSQHFLSRISKQLSSSSLNQKQRLYFSFSTVASPYVLCQESRSRTSDGTKVVDINLYDPRKDEAVKISDQTLPEYLYPSMKVGSSKGWVGTKTLGDSQIRLTNIYNPCVSASSHKIITLPPIEDHVCGISLSASPDDEQEDCVVAAMTGTSRTLYLCRPGDSKWIHTRLPHFTMHMLYSVRDEKFYLTSWRNDGNDQIDLFETSSGFPQVSLYQSFPNSDLLRFTSSHTFQYLVESPSGESFIVYWCNSNEESPFYLKPTGFEVFKQDRYLKIASYTKDIGDLCIFLGKSEAFCVSAKDYPGLKPNSIYYTRDNTGLGYFDLSTNSLHEIALPADISRPFLWLAPIH